MKSGMEGRGRVVVKVSTILMPLPTALTDDGR